MFLHRLLAAAALLLGPVVGWATSSDSTPSAPQTVTQAPYVVIPQDILAGAGYSQPCQVFQAKSWASCLAE
jgi:hypothetical protein